MKHDKPITTLLTVDDRNRIDAAIDAAYRDSVNTGIGVVNTEAVVFSIDKDIKEFISETNSRWRVKVAYWQQQAQFWKEQCEKLQAKIERRYGKEKE